MFVRGIKNANVGEADLLMYNNYYHEFDLQTSCLVHLFWSLFWGDMLNNHPVQFVWTRKLIFHLLNAKDSFSILSDDKNYSQIIINLYNYNLLAINLAIRLTSSTYDILTTLNSFSLIFFMNSSLPDVPIPFITNITLLSFIILYI